MGMARGAVRLRWRDPRVRRRRIAGRILVEAGG